MSDIPPDFPDGSYGGDDKKLSDDTVLECKICWHVYKPEDGDDYWQIPAGTPFSKLPDYWSCPNCDTAKSGFMVIERADLEADG